MKLSLTKVERDNYNQWDSFCSLSDDAWLMHTSKWIEFVINYKPELKSENRSFYVMLNNEIIAIVPLTVELNLLGFKEFSFGTNYTPIPALLNGVSDAQKKEIKAYIVEQIDIMAKKESICMAKFRSNTFSPNLDKTFSPLPENGVMEFLLSTFLIDLTQTEEYLWSMLRRNHRRSIKKADTLKVNFFDSTTITKDIFNLYVSTHRKASGRQTRPVETFDIMFDWIVSGEGFLVTVELDGVHIGFEMFSVYKNKVLGFSAANDPEYEDLYFVRHLLEWEAILWMKKQKYTVYDIGFNQYTSLIDSPDDKQLSITHFKKGFGGEKHFIYLVEKYYNKKYLLKIQADRIKQFSESIEFFEE